MGKNSSRKFFSPRTAFERCIYVLLASSAFLSIATTLGIIGVLLYESLLFFSEVPLSDFIFDSQWTPLFLDKHFGVRSLVCGTLVTSIVALSLALPCGLLIAIYLSEYASPGFKQWVKPLLELLAGIPTIVYGYFALTLVTPLLQEVIPWLPGFNALSAGIAMGIMILPMVASLSEDALTAVPRALREGSYALGSTRIQMIRSVLLPAAFGGITASFILAISRAVGETMIVAIAAGQQPILTLNPLSPVETMTAYIVQVSLGDTPHGTLEYHTIFAVGMALFALTFMLNSCSLWVRNRYRQVQ